MGKEIYSKDGIMAVGNDKLTFSGADEEDLFVIKLKYELKYILRTKHISDEEARKDMKQAKIKVWTLNSNGTKSPATRTISIHKEVAYEVVEIFERIFESPDN